MPQIQSRMPVLHSNNSRNKRKNWAARLRQYVLYVMDLAGLKSLEGVTCKLASRRNPPAVEISDPASIPAVFLRIPPPPAAPDKSAIKLAIQRGEDVPGARLNSSTGLVRRLPRSRERIRSFGVPIA